MIDLCQVDINVCAEQTWGRRCDILFQVRESCQSDDLMRIRHMGVVVVLKVLCILENLLNPVSCVRAQVSYLQNSQAFVWQHLNVTQEALFNAHSHTPDDVQARLHESFPPPLIDSKC